MPLWEIILAISGGIVAISAAIGVIRKPWKSAQATLENTISKVIDDKIGYIVVDFKHRMLYSIEDFAQDLRNGQKKNGAQFSYIIRVCDEYKNSGGNGQVGLDSEYIKEEYANYKAGYINN